MKQMAIALEQTISLALELPLVQRFKNLLLFFYLVLSTKTVYRLLRFRGIIGTISYVISIIAQETITAVRKSIPGADRLVQKQVQKSIESLQKGMCVEIPGAQKFISLPVKGLKLNEVVQELDIYSKAGHVDWLGGRVSGAVYHGGKDLNKLITEAFGKFTVANPLHPEIFPGVRKMESEIVSMVLKMYQATDDDAAGSVTSGGSESIIMSMKAHRDWALDKKGITEPEIVVPVSAHAAFDKGAHYLGIKLLHAPVDDSGSVIIEKLAAAINPNTIMIAGSTPSFPHGSIDNIPELAKLALKHDIGLHVDSCLGGFLIPFMEDAGYPLPFATDFRVKGVTSISCDTHKYGFAPKGSSVILYHSKDLRRYQYFLQTDWPGGVYGSPTMAGSRPGALSAGCWASMVYFGHSGYVESTKKIISASQINELEIIGNPLLSVVAFKSKAPVKIYAVGDLLSRKDYHLNILQFPPSIHIACTMLTPQLVDELLQDLKEIVETLKKDPNAGDGEKAAIYGTAASVPDRNIIGDVVVGFLDGLTKV